MVPLLKHVCMCKSLKKLNFMRTRSLHSTLNSEYLTISDRVKAALCANKPIVALESTIITHGLPWPNNYETAIEIENIIDSQNVVPATIGFLNGKLKVGLDQNELELIAKSHQDAIKLSRRDLSYMFAQASTNKQLIGGTTVSTTMIAAHAANIPIFVTGGIGGVHRDYNESMDVSADLFELGQTNVAVISSGIKSILDIGKTLEYLETLGVCVCALNETGSTEFPAFFTSKSGFNAPYNLKSPKDAASLINTHIGTGLKSGILIGVPVPSEHSIDSKLIEDSINDALKLAKEQNINGKHVTPFLLDKINRITRGTSMKSNIALIQNNARIGACIAKELAGLRPTVTNTGEDKSAGQSGYSIPRSKSSTAQVTLIGGINLDFAYKLKDEKTLTTKGVTQPCEFSQYMGGVARNMSESLLHLGIASTNLLSALATDFSGQYIIEQSKRIGFDTSKWLLLDPATETSTGSYCAVFDTQGELLSGYGAMDSHCLIRPSYIAKHIDILAESSLCVVDANCPVDTLEYIGNVCAEHDVPLWYNPTDVRKCTKIIEANQLTRTTYVSPNMKELYTMFAYLYRQKADVSGDSRMTQEELGQLGHLVLNNSQVSWTHDEIRLMVKYMLQYVPYIILTMGKSDLILASRNPISLYDRNQLPIKKSNRKSQYRTEWSPQLIYLPIIDLDRDELVVNVSGAGDSTSSGIIAGILKGYDLISSAYNGLLAAKYTLLTQKNVSESLANIDTIAVNKCIGKYKGRIRIEKL